MNQLTRVFLAVALAACCSDAIGSTAIRDYGPLGNGACVMGVVTASGGTHVVLADSTSGPVLLRIAADNSVVRAVHVGFFHATSLAKIPSGFLLTGSGRGDVPWVMSVNEQFEVNWSETLDGDFRPEAISAASDGSIYLGGYRKGYSMTAGVIKLAADGSISWRHTFHGSGHADRIYAVQATNDGVVAAGSTECGASLWKVRSDGTFDWQRCFSNGRITHFSAVTSVDDGFIAVGLDDVSLIVVKTNGAGLFRWKASAAGKYLAAATAVVASKDQIVVVGINEEVTNAATLLLAALTPDGKLVWQRAYGSSTETSAIAFSRAFSGQNAAADRDGGVVAAIGIGDSIRLLRFHRDGSIDDDCSGVSDSALSFLTWPPVGESTAVETQSFEARASRVQTSTAATTVSSSAPACSAAPKVASASGGNPPADVKQDRIGVYKETSDLLMTHKFAELDALADEWRRTRARVEPLSPKLLMLYDSVAGQVVSSQVGADEQEKLLKEWIAARPSSATALLALARYYQTQAGEKRGSSLTVSEKGSEESQRYIEASLKLLREHQQLAEIDPQYYAILIGVTQDGSQYFQLGTAQSDVDVIGAAAIFLLPQWGGTPEQYRRLMDVAVTRTKDDLGQTMYARLAWRLIEMACCDDKSKLWDTYHLDLSRIRQGSIDWSRLASSPVPLHRLAIMAYGHQDRKVLAEILSRPDVKWDSLAESEWQSKSAFDAAREWAFQKVSSLGSPISTNAAEHAAPAVTPIGPRTWPQVLLDSDLTLANGEHRRIWAFLAHGPNGVVAVSSVEAFRVDDQPGTEIARAQQQIVSWKLMRPTEPKSAVTVSGYVTPPASIARGIVLAIPPFKGKPILTPLDVAEALPPVSSKVFVAACPRSDATCKQRIYEGNVIGTGTSNDAKGKRATTGIYVFFDGLSSADLIGAPVLDEGGFAVGVVVGDGGNYSGRPATVCEGLPFLVNGR